MLSKNCISGVLLIAGLVQILLAAINPIAYAASTPPLLYSCNLDAKRSYIQILKIGDKNKDVAIALQGIQMFEWSGNHRFVLASSYNETELLLYRFDPGQTMLYLDSKARLSKGLTGICSQMTSYIFDWSKNESLISYQSSKGLVIVNLKDGHQTLLVSNKRFNSDIDAIAISPDTHQICFSVKGKDTFDANTGSKYEDLWIVNDTGTQLKRLGHGMFPHWSPDGNSMIAINGDNSFGNKLLKYTWPHTSCKTIWSCRYSAIANAVFSPTGRSIAVVGPYPSGNESPCIFLIAPDGRRQGVAVPYSALRQTGADTYLSW